MFDCESEQLKTGLKVGILIQLYLMVVYSDVLAFQEAGVPAGAITGILHYREKVKRKAAIGEGGYTSSRLMAGRFCKRKCRYTCF